MLCIIVLLQSDAPPIQFWNIRLHVSSYDASVYFKIRSAAAVSSHIISKDKWAVPLAAVHTHVTMVHRWSVILWTMSSSFFLLTFLIPSVHKTLSEMSPAFLCSFSELLFDLCSTGFCSWLKAFFIHSVVFWAFPSCLQLLSSSVHVCSWRVPKQLGCFVLFILIFHIITVYWHSH